MCVFFVAFGLLQERASHLCRNQRREHHHAVCKYAPTLPGDKPIHPLMLVKLTVLNSVQVDVEEEEKPEIVIKEKKEAKRSKSWGRRSTRAKKTISYRSEIVFNNRSCRIG